MFGASICEERRTCKAGETSGTKWNGDDCNDIIAIDNEWNADIAMVNFSFVFQQSFCWWTIARMKCHCFAYKNQHVEALYFIIWEVKNKIASLLVSMKVIYLVSDLFLFVFSISRTTKLVNKISFLFNIFVCLFVLEATCLKKKIYKMYIQFKMKKT